MDLKHLQKHIYTLATLEESAAPVISYYLNRQADELSQRLILTQHAYTQKQSLTKAKRVEFELAWLRIEGYVDTELFPDSKGVAIFARAGDKPFFLPLQFRVPLPSWISVNSTPNIYHLIELKDNYHRYVIMLCNEEQVRILEVNLGSVTAELWRERPELRKRVGREWTREHYQSHRRARTDQFIKEQIGVLEQLMTAKGHTHLILAGNPRIAALVKRALPRPLHDKLIDTVIAGQYEKLVDVVDLTLQQFIEQEERESRAVADTLIREIRTSGLATVGAAATLRALQNEQVDVLVIAKPMRDSALRERLVRLAEQNRCHVEVVNESALLMEFDGVGCLLRYALPETVPHTQPLLAA